MYVQRTKITSKKGSKFAQRELNDAIMQFTKNRDHDGNLMLFVYNGHAFGGESECRWR